MIGRVKVGGVEAGKTLLGVEAGKTVERTVLALLLHRISIVSGETAVEAGSVEQELPLPARCAEGS